MKEENVREDQNLKEGRNKVKVNSGREEKKKKGGRRDKITVKKVGYQQETGQRDIAFSFHHKSCHAEKPFS